MLAIILNRRDFRETDQIVILYSQDQGKLELLARGIKKITSKHSGNLLLGALVDIDLAQGKDINHLTKVQPICLGKNIRGKWQKSLLVNYVLELVDKMVAVGVKDERLFNLLKSWLEFVDQIETANNSLAYSFIARLSGYLGFEAEVRSCVRCMASHSQAVFSLEEGGLICEKCLLAKGAKENVVKLNPKQLINLQTMFYGDWAAVNQSEQSQIVFDLIHNFVQYHGEKKLSKFNINKLCQY